MSQNFFFCSSIPHLERKKPEDEKMGAILIFLPGELEINEMMKKLQLTPDLCLIPLHSRLPFEQAQKIL